MMERDYRLANLSAAIVNLSNECVAGGVSPVAVANEVALGVAAFLGKHKGAHVMAAVLREHAAIADTKEHRADLPEGERELLELLDRGLQFLRTLELSGISPSAAVTALHNACVIRVVQDKGARGAAKWLKALARRAKETPEQLEAIAKVS